MVAVMSAGEAAVAVEAEEEEVVAEVLVSFDERDMKDFES